MTSVDEIKAQITKPEAERESAMIAERANVLAKMKPVSCMDSKRQTLKAYLLHVRSVAHLLR